MSEKRKRPAATELGRKKMKYSVFPLKPEIVPNAINEGCLL